MNFLFWNKTNNWYINEEKVLKQPKKPLLNNKKPGLLMKFNATKIPKKNDAIKLTIEVLWILNPILIFKLFCIYILIIKPNVLPNKTIFIEVMSKIYIFIQPFVILLGSSNNLLEGNSTLSHISLLLTTQLRKIDKLVPISITNNSLELVSGKEYREVLEIRIISFVLLSKL